MMSAIITESLTGKESKRQVVPVQSSAVDMETEKFIQHSLNNLDFTCTKLIVAQRISTTKKADRIIVLKDGRISEMGTHEELLKLGGYYTEICTLQEAVDFPKEAEGGVC